jgi:hypothetical protein
MSFERLGTQVKWGWLAGVLYSMWLLPPMMHQVLHRCPLRPDGINTAEAVPAYARKYNVSCTQCHAAFPTLNAYGRQFKLNGYVRSKGSNEGVLETPDNSLWTEKIFPWGFVVRSRPFDKSSTESTAAMQAIHDVNFFLAGGDAANHVSWFGEITGEAGENFSPSIGDLQLGYHPSKYLNLVAARRGFFVMDPYQTLSNFGSPTVADRAIAGGRVDQGSLSGDVMDETKQTLAAYGRVSQEGLGGVYYAVGASATKDDDSGRGPKSGNLRLAFFTPKDNFMVGAFGSTGDERTVIDDTVDPSIRGKFHFSKVGADVMAEVKDLILRGAFLYGYDRDLTEGTRETNRSAYGELMYVFNRGDSGVPFLVPLIRQNWYQTTATDGSGAHREFSYFTAQLAHFFKANVKAFVEFSVDTKQDVTSADPTGPRQPKGNQVTLQAEVGF